MSWSGNKDHHPDANSLKIFLHPIIKLFKKKKKIPCKSGAVWVRGNGRDVVARDAKFFSFVDFAT